MIKKSLCLFLFIFSMLYFTPATAQEKRWNSEKEESRAMKEAEKLSKKAKGLWKDDQYAEAEKLYYQANQVYPLHYWGLNELAALKMELGDIRGANKVWDDRIRSLTQKFQSYLIYQKDINQYIWQTYYNKISSNLEKGSAEIAVKSTAVVLRNPPNNVLFGTETKMFSSTPTSHTGTPFLFLALAQAAFLLEDKESLQLFYDLLPTFESNDMFHGKKASLYYVDIFLKCLNGKYDEAIALLSEAADKGGGFFASKSLSTAYIPVIYSYKGDYDKSEELMGKSMLNPKSPLKKFVNGRNALGKKKYQEAIEYFTQALNPSRISDFIAKFTTCTNRAQAYEGLKDFQNAKKDYEAALVYEPSYEPARNGLARLEGRIITEQKNDKTPPEIIITEPAGARSIIVEADGDVTIKGMAKDQGGIKAVTINKEKAFLQLDGNFWGSVVLNEGMNKITITATDPSGNSAEKIIEVNKPTAKQELNIPTLKEEEKKDGRNFVLLIGCQNYDDSNIPSLENPVPDAVKLKLILKEDYNFPEDNIFTLYNPGVSDFKKKFLEIEEELQPEDNLVIFYAGHGVWSKKDEKGYWLLTDAKFSDHDTWLPNKQVLQMIASLKAKHILLITDACFSGSVFRTRGLDPNAPPVVKKMEEKISRVAITSGNDTEVPDKSVFMTYLIKALKENKEKYLSAQKMFITRILEAVMTETHTEPRYGTLELAGHLGGDFIFYKK